MGSEPSSYGSDPFPFSENEMLLLTVIAFLLLALLSLATPLALMYYGSGIALDNHKDKDS